MMNVKLFKFVTGEEVVAEVVSETDSSLEIKNMLAILLVPSKDGQIGMQFMPWGSVAAGSVSIDKSKTVFIADLKEDVKNTYSSFFSSIVTPTKQLIT